MRLAEGQSVRDMAEATGHATGAIYWHLKQIYQELLIPRQVGLARLVLAVAEFGQPRRWERLRWTVRLPPACFLGNYQSW